MKAYSHWPRAAAGALTVLAAAATQASVSFDISFDDPGALYSSYYSELRSSVQAAGDEWIAHFQGLANTTLQVQIGFANIPTANGTSATSSYVDTVGGISIWEQGAAAKIKTGADVNGVSPDILFNVGINGYLQNLWFDPNPVAKTAVVPNTQTDARSVFVHEFGHAFGFNGWRDGQTGALPSNYQSTYDSWVSLANVGGSTYEVFTGPNAMAVYGGPVPLTFGNYAHLGNGAGQFGSNLISDLMNGVVYYYGTRYEISALDLAIMQDLGFSVDSVADVPEPSTYAMLLLGLAAVAMWRRRQAAVPAGAPLKA